MSGGGSVALGSSVTLTNAGVTSLNGSTGALTGVSSVAAGSGISVSSSTGAVTISATGGGTVTSVATGNGLSGGTITSTGTLTIAAPTAGSVGSYSLLSLNSGSVGVGGSVSSWYYTSITTVPCGGLQLRQNAGVPSGTWRAMAQAENVGGINCTLFCRIS